MKILLQKSFLLVFLTSIITFSVNAQLSVDATASPDTICQGAASLLTADTSNVTGTITYSWISDPVGFTSTSKNPSVSPTVTTTYTVTVIDDNDTISDYVTVTVVPLPVANAGSNVSVCKGDCTVLTASGGVSYLWSTLETTATINVCPGTTNTYFVTVTDGNGCTDSDYVTVVVKAVPTADAGLNTSICKGDCTALTAGGGVSYLWSTLETTATINVCPSSTTTYTVTVTGSNGCTDSDYVTVAVKAVPTADAGPNSFICLGECSVLTASGGVSYLWSTGITTATMNVCPTSTTNYIVTVTGVNGCSDSDNVTITVWPLPTANAGADVSICVNECTNLTAIGGIVYNWSTGDNTATINVCPLSTETYTVTVTNANGCTDSDNVIVTVMPLPTADAGPDVSVCLTDCVNLTGAGGINYTWNNGLTNSIINVCPSTTTTYTVTVAIGSGCSDSDDVTVTVMPLPTANAGPDVQICLSDCTDLMASGGLFYLWNTGGNTAIINVCPVNTETYTVTVTDVNGCTNSDNVIVTVIPFPIVDAGADATICENDSLLINDATAMDYNSIEWSSTEGSFSNANVLQTYYKPVDGPGYFPRDITITLTALPNPPCTGQVTDTITITLLPAIDQKALVAKPFPENGHPVVLITTDSGYQYQWFIDDDPIPNETGQFYYKPGGIEVCKEYMVRIENNHACRSYSYGYEYCPSKNSVFDENELFVIYPNPAQAYFRISLNENIIPKDLESSSLNVIDVTGKIVLQSEIDDIDQRINCYNLSKGLYFIEIKVPGIQVQTKKILLY